MNTVWEFAKAAAPWVAAGLCVIIIAVRSVTGKGKTKDGDYGAEGMCLGMCFGLLVGTMLEGGTGTGISIGMLIGLSVGMCIPKKQDGGDK